MAKLYLYEISADGGNTWTPQWLSENEASEHEAMGYIVKQQDPKLHFKEV